MKITKNIIKTAAFIMIFLMVFTIFDRIGLNKKDISPTWEIVQDKDSEPLDILFMGSSHYYCNINPVIINQALDINTNLLGASSQPIDAAYENLSVLLHYIHPKIIVLDPYTLSTTSQKIQEMDKVGYLYNNIDAIKNPFYRLRFIMNTLSKDKWLEGFSQLFRPLNTWTRFNQNEKKESNGTILGFQPRSGFIDDKTISLQKLEQNQIEVRNSGKMPQDPPNTLETLRKFLELAQKEDITIYILDAPVARKGTAETLNSISELSKSFSNVRSVINSNEKMTEIGLTLDDFYDNGHLNRIGAQKFTVWLTQQIAGWLDLTPNFKRVSYYMNESLKENTDGTYRYAIETFDNTLVKFAVKDKKGNLLEETSFSDQKYIDIPKLTNDTKLYFRIKEKEPGRRSYPVENIEFQFMRDMGIFSNYNKSSFSIITEGNHIAIQNNFKDVPVIYNWYIFKEEKKFYQQTYQDSTDSFEYDFDEPGEYHIRAYIRTLDKNPETTAVNINFTVNDSEEIILK